MALKAQLICCDPLVVALSNNLKSKKYYLSKFPSNKSGKWGKMTHVISDLLFSNKNYAQKATSTVQACFIKKTDKRARISKIQSNFFLAHWYAFKLPAKTTLRNFPDGGSRWFSYPQVTPMYPSKSFFSSLTWPIIPKTASNSKGWPHCVMLTHLWNLAGMIFGTSQTEWLQ